MARNNAGLKSAKPYYDLGYVKGTYTPENVVDNLKS